MWEQVSTQSICRWFKMVITMSDQHGTGGSTRSVYTSTASGRVLNVEHILQTEDWTGSKTFR